MNHKQILEKAGIITFNETDEEIRISCPSPDHLDDNPSASYSKKKKLWYCHGCNKKGHLSHLIDGLEDIEITYSLEDLLDDISQLETPKEENFKFFPQEFEKIFNESDCPYYLTNRLEIETIVDFNLHICRKKSSIYNQRIIIPIETKGNLAFQARDYTGLSSRKYIFPKNMPKSNFIFSKQVEKETIIVEGAFDVMSMWQKGFKNCAALLGADLSDNQVKTLLEFGAKKLIIFGDGDEGGIKLIEKTINKNKFFDIDIMACKWGKDPSDLSKEEIQNIYDSRVSHESITQKQQSNNLNFLTDDLEEMERRDRKLKSYLA